MGWRCQDRQATATDCVVAHWMPQLPGGARRAKGEPAGWHADCPVCGAGRALSVGLGRGGRPVWHQHCGCDDGAVGKALADRVACWHHGRAPRGTAPKVDAAIAVLMDRTRSSSAKVAGALRALGVPDAEIWPALGLSRTQRYAVIAELGQKPRSQGVSPENRTEPQVTAPVTRKAPGVRTGRSQGDTVRKTGQKPRSGGVRKTELGPGVPSPENRTNGQVTAPVTRSGAGLTTRGIVSAPAAPDALAGSTTPAPAPGPDGTLRTAAGNTPRTSPGQGHPPGESEIRGARSAVTGLPLVPYVPNPVVAAEFAAAQAREDASEPTPGQARTEAARAAAHSRQWDGTTKEERRAIMARRREIGLARAAARANAEAGQ